MDRIIAHVSALRPMEDSVNWAAIPVGTPLVAGYVSPSGFAWPAAAWARFAGSIEVRITPSASVTGLGIQVLDIETGDATPAQAPGWAVKQRAKGQVPTCYCSMSVWQAVQNAFNAARVPHPEYWVAGYPGGGPSLPTLNGITAVAHQYADPATSGGDWDTSVVAPVWPGVDTGVTDMPLTSTDVNAIWSGPVWAQLGAGSAEAQFAITVLGVKPNTDGSVTIATNSAGAWLSISSVRVAMLEQQVTQLAAAVNAIPGDITTAESALVAAIHGVQAGSVDVNALAAALVPLLSAADATALVAALKAQFDK